MYVKDVLVQNQVGLHARPATFFIQKANEFRSTIMVENSTLRADSLIYGTPDGETGQPGYYGPVTLSHNATYEKVYTTAADAPETAVILDAATSVECKPMSEGGTYPIIQRGQDDDRRHDL